MRMTPFSAHPHAGFSAVTYVFDDSPGGVRSRTSDGADFIVPGTDVPLPLVRLIGLLEVTGALGLILPGVTHIAPVVVGVAALFLGAILFHMRRTRLPVTGMRHSSRSRFQPVNVARVMQKKTRSSGWTCWGSSAPPWPCRGRARGNPAAPRVQLLAAGYVLGAVILWAVGTVLGRYALSGISFTTTSAMRFILALPVLLGLMLHDLGPAGFSGYALGQVPNFLGIAVIPD